ncbi:hypothetical protein D3C86_2121830 [compost metagenome]
MEDMQVGAADAGIAHAQPDFAGGGGGDGPCAQGQAVGLVDDDAQHVGCLWLEGRHWVEVSVIYRVPGYQFHIAPSHSLATGR